MNVDWTERFQGTSALPGHVRDRLVNVARILRFEEGTQVFGPTNIPDSLFSFLMGAFVFHKVRTMDAKLRCTVLMLVKAVF